MQVFACILCRTDAGYLVTTFNEKSRILTRAQNITACFLMPATTEALPQRYAIVVLMIIMVAQSMVDDQFSGSVCTMNEMVLKSLTVIMYVP